MYLTKQELLDKIESMDFNFAVVGLNLTKPPESHIEDVAASGVHYGYTIKHNPPTTVEFTATLTMNDGNSHKI